MTIYICVKSHYMWKTKTKFWVVRVRVRVRVRTYG